MSAEIIGRPEPQNPKQILFIGNSYISHNDSLYNYVKRIAAKASNESARRYKFKSITISGSYLKHHFIESYLEKGRLGLSTPFDYVILQGNSSVYSTKKKRIEFLEQVSFFANEIKQKNSKTALYMTPAYVAPHNKASKTMMEKVQKLYEEAGDLNNSIVIPVGLSFKKAYEINPKIQLHKDDGSHPSVLGTYLAAATVFATLYGKSPENNEYDHFGLIKPKELVFLQKVANDTVEEYFANLN